MPSPRLIDPSVFFDIIKIRRSVDEAAQDCVRAATGISNTPMTGRMDYFGSSGGPSSKLSKERIFKIRQKAVRQLAQAFSLDEVATSVATMQATSTIEDVADHVMRREAQNRDAKYVHYFQEKIPSRAVDFYTPLEPLNEIIAMTTWEEAAPYYRTRAIVKTFKYQWEGAVADLTMALRIVEELKKIHKPGQQQLELASRMNKEREAWQTGQKDWRAIPHLKEEDRPTSLEMQLYFNRGNVYLTMATLYVDTALTGLKEYLDKLEKGVVTEADAAAQAKRVEARSNVKKYAKRALKDFMSFLSYLEYTPGIPNELADQIVQQMNELTSTGTRPLQARNGLNGNGSTELVKKEHKTKKTAGPRNLLAAMKPTIYTANVLFAEKPPADIPPFPREDGTSPGTHDETLDENFSLREAITYHPLLTDVLHTVLLTHCLIQTSPTELLRHAHNAARLICIADGYPIFQPAISPARGGWRVVLRLAENWIGLKHAWSDLCAFDGRNLAVKKPQNGSGGSTPLTRSSSDILAQSVEKVDELNGVNHAKSNGNGTAPVLEELEVPLPRSAEPDVGNGRFPSPSPESRFMDKEKQYPFSIERAENIARWVRDSPLSLPGVKKRKTRARKSAKSAAVDLTGSKLAQLAIDGDDDDVD
ncbi:hypothetical protein MRB53_040587 [Persea americana]|nr:hypothetical protein MRB53_040587 [Persea americana]